MGGIFDRFVGLSATVIDCRRKGVQLVGGADVIMAVAVLLTLRFGTVLLLYSRPMEDMTLDLSRVNHTGHVTPDSGDEKAGRSTPARVIPSPSRNTTAAAPTRGRSSFGPSTCPVCLRRSWTVPPCRSAPFPRPTWCGWTMRCSTSISPRGRIGWDTCVCPCGKVNRFLKIVRVPCFG